MRNAGGYAIICDPCAPIVELDTFTCKHCNRVVHVKVNEKPEDTGGFCTMCTGLICPTCVDKGDCTPFEERLERMERRADWLRSYMGS